MPQLFLQMYKDSDNSSLSKFIEGAYEFDPTIIYGCTVTEEEQKIYDTPDEEDYDYIYTNPPTEEDEIYEVLKGNNVNTFYHRHIRYHAMHSAVTVASYHCYCRILECLGSGEFGIVSHGLLDDNLEVAVKTLNVNSSDKDRLKFLQEAAIMCQFDHKNVIKLLGVVTEAPITIVLEYMSHGDLRQLLIELRSL